MVCRNGLADASADTAAAGIGGKKAGSENLATYEMLVRAVSMTKMRPDECGQAYDLASLAEQENGQRQAVEQKDRADGPGTEVRRKKEDTFGIGRTASSHDGNHL